MVTMTEQFYKPYIVKGQTIEVHSIKAAEAILRRPRFFFSDVEQALLRSGVSNDVSDRATDRLLQRARPLGLISRIGQGWSASAPTWETFDKQMAKAKADVSSQ